MVKLDVGEEVLESSQQQKRPSPGAVGQFPAKVSRLSFPEVQHPILLHTSVFDL